MRWSWTVIVLADSQGIYIHDLNFDCSCFAKHYEYKLCLSPMLGRGDPPSVAQIIIQPTHPSIIQPTLQYECRTNTLQQTDSSQPSKCPTVAPIIYGQTPSNHYTTDPHPRYLQSPRAIIESSAMDNNTPAHTHKHAETDAHIHKYFYKHTLIQGHTFPYANTHIHTQRHKSI